MGNAEYMGKSRKTMGISRDSFHKRRKTGGKLTPWRKKRKFELGRPPSMTKIGGTRIHTDVKKSAHVLRKLKARDAAHTLAREMEAQFIKGRPLAKVSSRPGQSGRCDGYIIEGVELKFYDAKMAKKKGAK